MTSMAEEPVDIKYRIEPESTAILAQICADCEETGQLIENKNRQLILKQESPNRYENLPQTGEQNSRNGDFSDDINMNVENGVSEEVQIKSESICEVEDNFLKIKEVCSAECNDINAVEEEGYEHSSFADCGGNENSIPEVVNSDVSTVSETHADVTMTEEENTRFEWEKLFTPSPTNFTYPEDEKEIETLAATLWEMRLKLLGRDLHDVTTVCSFASQWKTISEESKNYVYQRMSLLYLAVTRGWGYALAAAYPNSEYTQKRPAHTRPYTCSYRPYKRRRMFFHVRTAAISNKLKD